MPRIRYHSKEDGYCLPYEVRSDFSDHSLLLRNLEVAFWDGIRTRAKESGELTGEEVEAVAEINAHAIRAIFDQSGSYPHELK